MSLSIIFPRVCYKNQVKGVSEKRSYQLVELALNLTTAKFHMMIINNKS